MPRPKGKQNTVPAQEGRPTIEELQRTVGVEKRPDPKFPEPPPIEFIAAALTGILSHLCTTNPYSLTREGRDAIMKAAFDLAESAELEHKRRYGE